MFSASTLASFTLIAAAAPVLSAPIPAAQGAAELDARFSIPTGALKKLGEGLLTGGAIQGLEKLLGVAAPSTTAAASAPAAPTPRAFSDLSDDEVNQLLEWVNGHAPQARDLEARFSLPSGLLGKLVKGGITTGGISILGDILGKLTGGSDADSTATATAATSAPTVDSRAFSDLSDDEVNQLLEWVNDNANASQARDLEARLSFPSGIFKKILQGLAGGAGTQLLGGLLGGGGDVAAPSTEAATVPAATATAPVAGTTP
ncbi:hypothetical protein B0H10DRAFT_158415 [Mycena sp. CBHHK59/15]|nr:hypothetical protein B0H10DRAFT_158415 [Mycena sp. CBHHK59/15]